ncbi:hypothetical protein C922_05207 [Plasmodium inui San Antonio 1]|uniref:Uncharacterized protein n=1 Tax=Plasmodium inui San Antonio 1 TaxID=1237626 RepID=W6ZYI4_9APIC|nr:hypothetical protein C922_05207 [Plasmodium inui San Antonio 1]EUD64408.1 hypothetical protein C922_05207 [Plasmodium inui San Antonio 1]
MHTYMLHWNGVHTNCLKGDDFERTLINTEYRNMRRPPTKKKEATPTSGDMDIKNISGGREIFHLRLYAPFVFNVVVDKFSIRYREERMFKCGMRDPLFIQPVVYESPTRSYHQLMGEQIDSRHFDYVLPFHVDVDQINEANKTCIYVSGNVNPQVYSQTTSGRLIKLLGGAYNYHLEREAEAQIRLSGGMAQTVSYPLLGPQPKTQMFSGGIESPQFNIRIEYTQGFRDDREKTMDQIIVRNFEQIIDQGMYKFQQFHVRIEILRECTYVLVSIINSIILNFIHNNISLNFVVNSVNIGIVDRNEYGTYVEELSRLCAGSVAEGPGHVANGGVNINQTSVSATADKLFYSQPQMNIPEIILAPLGKELSRYCPSAFCFIVAPEFQKLISNIVLDSSVGMWSEVFSLSRWYS